MSEDTVRRMLDHIGEDPCREGLLETPARVVRSWSELFSGYSVANPVDLLKSFVDGACDEMVVLRGITFTSFCEHHMLPFAGVAHVGYVPSGRVVGVSKLARLVDAYARRLQIQERIGTQVVEALMDPGGLDARGAGCVIEAKHLCMACRGVNKQGSIMVTSAIRGVFKDAAPRAEFLQMAGL